LSALMALEGVTSHAAAAAGEAAVAGRIAPGHRADLTAFAADPLTTPAGELPDTPIALTVVGGSIQHRAV
ncbi:amidohydrolase family protein, partial [Streptomyces albidoflavus]|nr:amidohydrolase family protein [Streptomyces albidoflavus]